MADDEPREDSSAESKPPKTPFDNPYFLPVLLWILAVWFAYDGWFNDDMEWVKFNRYGFVLIVVLAAWFTRSAVIERREEREKGSSA